MSDPAFRLQVRSKIWLEVDGEPVFGRGREELLRLIQNGNSINAAAKAMGIPYRKAWTYIDAMEKRLGLPLVNRQKGGVGGGASSLTPQAMQMLDKFNALQQGMQGIIDDKFHELFSLPSLCDFGIACEPRNLKRRTMSRGSRMPLP
ncbi:MAG: winged helix-turn-helix domain-containing protein [Proteobacteria bacterium]|nr:winged helix-turn-helix domain-containing protein [Pseudomonadota bacterium]MBU4581503.1 winged helix-turn-helix domain-containing protein [Pseudomonadota bacterium]MCG2741689.1 winged helix-turn-helix domain-containing protein [Syntrophaceae bacterium]